MGAGGRETEEGKKRKGERHLLNIYEACICMFEHTVRFRPQT